LSGVAPLNSPTFTGTPLAPTAGSGTNNTQVATTAFVSQAIANLTGIVGSFSITGNINTANNVIASGVLTSVGNVTGGNLRTTGIVTATGNITTAGNLTVGGTVQSTGNVIVARLISIGNVSGTNFSANGNAVVTGNVLSSGNITAINLVANSSINTQNANVFNTLSVAGGIKQNQFTKLGNSTGQPGQIVWDTNYIYVCTATNVWKRVALTSF
jgi:cytoskeletal protein CcmA (bactofilin family)